ncbi:glutamate ABC transporter substrate-binding protein [Granulicoccus sp. GXG6511]|uniref:glutamate ABC transporter substrate-binding protein n=1 Tax=Granulicoccus sp. GXG6511 TaxID=3381351 RepID=UPI003D7DD386
MIRRLTGSLVGALTIFALAACGATPTVVPPVPEPTQDAAPPAAAGPTCDNATQSYAPTGLPGPDDLPSGSTMAAIKQRGRLVVGVSSDSYLLGSRNPQTGVIEGFDIDMAHAMAKAIFGADAQAQLRVISAADRIPLLEAHEVDLVVRNMTMTCDRWEQIGFSAEYYRSGQKLMVRKGSGITNLDTLAERRVCAPRGTSTLNQIRELAPGAELVPADTHTGCLVLFQQGRVDAITGDDTVLAGLAAQDPYGVVLPGDAFTEEPYGIGVPADQVDMARFANAVLERMRADGRWQASYDRWLRPTLGEGQQPNPVYGRDD